MDWEKWAILGVGILLKPLFEPMLAPLGVKLKSGLTHLLGIATFKNAAPPPHLSDLLMIRDEESGEVVPLPKGVRAVLLAPHELWKTIRLFGMFFAAMLIVVPGGSIVAGLAIFAVFIGLHGLANWLLYRSGAAGVSREYVASSIVFYVMLSAFWVALVWTVNHFSPMPQ